MNIEDRLRELFSHLGIRRAHIASAGFYGPSGRICTQAPDLVASMTLVCPLSVPQSIDTDIALPFSICTGDRGELADTVASALQGSDHAHHILLKDCAPLLWDDLVNERTRELGDAIFSFLDSVDEKTSMTAEHLEQDSGMVAELAYRVMGSGPPLILFPFALAPSQWDPLLGELSARFTVVLVSGAHVPPGVNLESRVGNPGYLEILKTCFEFLDIKPGATILEVGCGTGAVSRVLAEYTKRKNPITGMDLNAFLRREAKMLNEAAGFADLIEILEGNAYALPVADNTFDISLSVTVLEEVDADRAIAEMVRVTSTWRPRRRSNSSARHGTNRVRDTIRFDIGQNQGRPSRRWRCAKRVCRCKPLSSLGRCRTNRPENLSLLQYDGASHPGPKRQRYVEIRR